MNYRMNIAIILAFCFICQVSNATSKTDETKANTKEPLASSDSTIRLSQLESINNPSGNDNGITTSSIHRVWTASSSGSLDELSPEMIGKLNQDVPFLAAYALRPRLVGSSSNRDQLTSNSMNINDNIQKLDGQQLASSSSGRLNRIVAPPTTLGGASNQDSLVAQKLGDFSEFNVDVSSTSKSEHHHRRKTTLKKKSPTKLIVTGKSQKSPRTIDNLLSELKMTSSKRKRGAVSVRERARSRNQSSRNKKNNKRLQRRRLLSRSSKKRGRLIGNKKRRSGSKSRGKLRLKSTSNNQHRQFGRQVELASNGTKGGGQSLSSSDKPAFFEQSGQRSNEGVGVVGAEKNSIDDQGDNSNGSDSDSEAEEPELKRAGDGDVEEGGDTVEVEPKYDGVDDDPELPEEMSPEDQDERGVVGEKPDDNSMTEPKISTKSDSESDSVGNSDPNSDSNSEMSDDDDDDMTMVKRDENSVPSSMTIGGGIGATTGGNGGNTGITGNSGSKDVDNDDHDVGNNNANGHDDRDQDQDDNDENDDQDRTRIINPGANNNGSGSSVEFADDRRNSGTFGSDSNQDNFGNRRSKPNANDNPSNSNGATDGHDNGDDDGGDDRLIKEGKKQATNDDYDDRDNEEDNDSADKPRRKFNASHDNSAGSKSDDKFIDDDKYHCNHHNKNNGSHDDGHYDHSLDHEHDNHHHHDTIDWLRKSIPGEPGRDYPTLSRINSTNFHCSDQKWPGFYADVDLDCQVS